MPLTKRAKPASASPVLAAPVKAGLVGTAVAPLAGGAGVVTGGAVGSGAVIWLTVREKVRLERGGHNARDGTRRCTIEIGREHAATCEPGRTSDGRPTPRWKPGLLTVGAAPRAGP